MKVVFITDTHLGVRNSNSYFLEYQKARWVELVDYMNAEGITEIFHGGDFFDNRNSISIIALDYLNHFLDLIKKNGIKITAIVGNHDVAYKNDNSLNASDSLLPFDIVYESPVTVIRENMKIDLIPWINNSNFNEIRQFITASDSNMCLGHFEINGAPFHRGGHVCEGGIDAALFSKYSRVFSGHFHTRSQVGRVEYIGAGFDYTWADFNDPRGFVVVDCTSLEVEYVDWKTFMFVMIEMDAEGELKFLPECDSIENKYVRVISEATPNKKMEAALAKLEEQKPAELQVFFRDENSVIKSEVDLSDAVDDTHVMKAVLEVSIENESFRNQVSIYLEELYREASVQ